MNATDEYGDYEGEAGRLYAERHLQPGPGEYAWLTRVADEEGDPICELACGHGRLCIPLARLGHTVVGLDRSQTLIERAVQQAMREPESVRARLKFLRGDLRTFELGQPFRYIFIFFGGFSFLKQRGERVACLRRAYEHLLPGGLLEMKTRIRDRTPSHAKRWRGFLRRLDSRWRWLFGHIRFHWNMLLLMSLRCCIALASSMLANAVEWVCPYS